MRIPELKKRFGWVQSWPLLWRGLVTALPLLVGFILSLPDPRTSIGAPTSAVPADFNETLIASVSSPTALAFTPDGRLLITSQSGTVRVYKNGALLATPALDISSKVCPFIERGLLGVAVDPAFASNKNVYLYYSFNKFNNGCPQNSATSPVNRISRFTFKPAPNDDQLDPASELVLIDNIPSPNGNHNAGDLHFGQDGYLYISVGDGGCSYLNSSKCAGGNDISRNRNVLVGKILRIKPDGSVPPTNPYLGTDSARCNQTGVTDAGKKCQEIYAWGFRNPFRFAIKPGTNLLHVNDVCQNIWEEIDLLRPEDAGSDYGWNVREGPCANNSTTDCGAPPAGMTNPIYWYDHSAGCISITGGVFVPVGVWPSTYDGAYLFSDYGCPKIFRLVDNSGSYSATEFATGLTGGAIAMTFGPSSFGQSLYYTTFGGNGQLRRIDYTGTANRTPTASFTASPLYFPTAPKQIDFNASASSDPDAGNTLSYVWDFGDNSPVVTVTTPITSHTYTLTGTYTPTLRVRDNLGAISNPVTTTIVLGDTPPVPKILSPAPDKLFRVGETITLTGSAIDPEDASFPDSAFVWTVLLHHNNSHVHYLMNEVAGNNLTFAAPAPEDLAATELSYVEIQLKVTDSGGASTTITQSLQPRKVNVGFATVPDGLNLEVNGGTITSTQTLLSWDGYNLLVNAPTQTWSSQTVTFGAWSDGGAASHTIVTPSGTMTYTATFVGNNCIDVVVTQTSDDGGRCGTLRYAVNAALPDSRIGIVVSGPIILNSNLDINKRLNIQGVCGPSGPAVFLNAAPTIPLFASGLTMHGGVTLNGIKISGFKVNQLKASGQGNKLSCVSVTH